MEFRAAVGRHPNAASLLSSWTRAQEPMAALSEAVFSNLADAGLQGRALLEAYNTYLGYVQGASVTEVLNRTAGEQGAPSRRQVDSSLWERHPCLVAAVSQFGELAESVPEAELRTAIFRVGVETVLTGLQVRYQLATSSDARLA
jgi:hypothetical protein